MQRPSAIQTAFLPQSAVTTTVGQAPASPLKSPSRGSPWGSSFAPASPGSVPIIQTYGSYPLGEPMSPVKMRSHQRVYSPTRGWAGQQQLQGTAQVDPSNDQAHIESNFLDLPANDRAAGKKANLPWLDPDVVRKRRIEHGLQHPTLSDFMENTEFISLGCFCGVTRGLQCLGVKQLTYPFDWVRTNAPSTVRCFERDFNDFCSSSFVGESPAPGVVCRGGSSWGGSFFHHDPSQPKTQADFKRRIERLKGEGEVGPTTRRVFLFALNSLSDLTSIPKLKSLVSDMLPDADVYLLVMIDNQPAKGLVRVLEEDSNVLFYWNFQEMFEDMGAARNGKEGWSEKRHAEAYAEGLAAALRVWSGVDGDASLATVQCYQDLYSRCMNFESGDPSSKLFWPLRIANTAAPSFPESKLSRQSNGPASPKQAQPALKSSLSISEKPVEQSESNGNYRDLSQTKVIASSPVSADSAQAEKQSLVGTGTYSMGSNAIPGTQSAQRMLQPLPTSYRTTSGIPAAQTAQAMPLQYSPTYGQSPYLSSTSQRPLNAGYSNVIQPTTGAGLRSPLAAGTSFTTASSGYTVPGSVSAAMGGFQASKIPQVTTRLP